MKVFFMLLIFSTLSKASLLESDFKCKGVEGTKASILSIEFAKELYIESKLDKCNFNIRRGSSYNRVKSGLVLHLEKSKCSDSKKFMDKGVLKLDITNKVGYLHVFKGKDPLPCKVENFRLEKVMKAISNSR